MHYKDFIYLDHQASTPVAEPVLEKMLPFFRENAGNPHSSEHIVGWKSAEAVDAAKSSIAQLVGADPDEVFFTSGATEANNLALLGIGRRAHRGSRNRILVSSIEHKCTLAAARALKEHYGFSIETLPVDAGGRVLLAALEDAIDENVLVVSVMAVNNEIGTIQDIEQVAAIAHSAGAYVHCDAAQAPVALNISRFSTHVDLMSLSAHKIYGPQGIGALFVQRGLQDKIEPIIYGGGQQDGIRSGTLPLPLCVGMGAAADLLQTDSASDKRERLRSLRDLFVSETQRLPWEVSVNGTLDHTRHPGNANLRFHGFSGSELLGNLQPRLAASTGSACSSGIPEPSHVLRAIGLTAEEAESSIRFSLGFDTTKEEIDIAIDLIRKSLRISEETL